MYLIMIHDKFEMTLSWPYHDSYVLLAEEANKNSRRNRK